MKRRGHLPPAPRRGFHPLFVVPRVLRVQHLEQRNRNDLRARDANARGGMPENLSDGALQLSGVDVVAHRRRQGDFTQRFAVFPTWSFAASCQYSQRLHSTRGFQRTSAISVASSAAAAEGG